MIPLEARAVEPSVMVPLFVRFPLIDNEDAPDARVNVLEGKVFEITRLLQSAAVPAAIIGILGIPAPLVIVTSVKAVGTAFPHQLEAVDHELVVPFHPPVPKTVIFAVADVDVQEGPVAVIVTLT